LKGCESQRKFLLSKVRVSKIGVETGYLWLDGDGLAVIADGFSVLLFGVPGGAEVAVPGGKRLIDFRGAVVILRGLSNRFVAAWRYDGVRVGSIARIFRGELGVNQLGRVIVLAGHEDSRLNFFSFFGRSRKRGDWPRASKPAMARRLVPIVQTRKRVRKGSHENRRSDAGFRHDANNPP